MVKRKRDRQTETENDPTPWMEDSHAYWCTGFLK